jgi:hypothetical protein
MFTCSWCDLRWDSLPPDTQYFKKSNANQLVVIDRRAHLVSDEPEFQGENDVIERASTTVE